MDQLPTWAVRVLKLLLFALLFYALFTLTIMIGSADTGPMEKVVLALLTVGGVRPCSAGAPDPRLAQMRLFVDPETTTVRVT